jgi:DNA methylase/ParB-like nuclease domain
MTPERTGKKAGIRGHAKPPGDASRLAVVYRPIAELKLDPKNPRRHSPRQINQIARSIKSFGFITPILIDASSRVIAGHGRLMAAQHLGLSEAPTICVDHLSEAQVRVFMIADNRLTDNSFWDERLLAEQLKELSLLDLDFSLELTGFEMGEIDLRIEGLTPDSEGDEDTADALPASGSRPTVSRAGDLWLLDDHRVYCGSALDGAAYAVLMQRKKAAMVFADSPYNVPIEGNVSGLGAVHHREFAMASGEMKEAEFTEFLTKALSLHARQSAEGSLHFICMDWRHLGELLAAGKTVYTELKNLCVWVKNHTGMGAFYRSRHELVLVFKHGRAPHRNNIQLGRYGRDRTNVWAYPSPRTPSEEGNLLALHPTVKPVALVADAIMDCTARGDIVLDGFLGSGTTVIAAERTGRRCYGLEIDPQYVDTVVRRWQAFTGGEARQAISEHSFRELEARAEAQNGSQER